MLFKVVWFILWISGWDYYHKHDIQLFDHCKPFISGYRGSVV